MPKCDTCRQYYEEGGDGYCGLCPGCADKAYPADQTWHCQNCGHEDAEDEFFGTEVDHALCPKCGNSTDVFPK